VFGIRRVPCIISKEIEKAIGGNDAFADVKLQATEFIAQIGAHHKSECADGVALHRRSLPIGG
jgi:hypothetical protein